jgi:hypothetical protein
MPSIAPAFLIVALITAAPGCWSTSNEKTDVKAQEAKKAVKDYAYAQKAEFVAEMKKDLAKTEQELDQLSAKVEKSTGAAKADAKLKLDALREKHAQAKQRIDEAEGATEDTWDEVKASSRQSYEDMKKSFDETRQWVSDEIEP